MKKYFLLFLSLISSSYLIAQEPITKDGLYYFVNGDLYHGSFVTKYGADNSIAVFQVKKGRLNGKAIFYGANKTVMETGYFKNGKPDGLWESFDEAGRLAAQGNYVYGKKHGKWIIWDAQGAKRYEMTYRSGLKINTWYMWNENKVLVAQKTFVNQEEQYNRQVYNY